MRATMGRPLKFTFIAVAAFLTISIFYVLNLDRPESIIRPTRSTKSRSSLLDDVYNATLGFEKIFAISLASRTDRRDSLALAATFTNLTIDVRDGVDGKTVGNKVLPPGGIEYNPVAGVRGCWRSHMNALLEMVQKNISTALILEDDADWDIRIKPQMYDFARSSNLLLQPLASNPAQYADPSYPIPENAGPDYVDLDVNKAPATVPPSWSPYGDHWELLWFGHCGDHMKTDNEKIPRGRAVLYDDETVIGPEKYDPIFGDKAVIEQYPAHTRIVAHHEAGVCTMGYAVTNAAARRLLYTYGIQELTNPWDIALQSYCNGALAGKVRNCLSPRPSLISRHEPKGRWSTFSDIADGNPEDTNSNPTAFSHNIRMSARVNLPKFVDGETDFIDSFPDES